MIQFAAKTHPGLKRSHNEDCYAADPVHGLWLVADGIGGHSCGEVASAIVRDTACSAAAAGAPLDQALHLAHKAVLDEIANRRSASNMGSTAVLLAVEQDRYRVAWVGDSRAYLWNGRTLTRLTRDHSKVGALVEAGIITEKDAATHPGRHVLIQSLGVSSKMPLKPGEVQGSLDRGDQILLCTDGLTDELSDAEIARLLPGHGSTQAQVDSLVDAALAAGGSDNVTVILVGMSDQATDGKSSEQPAPRRGRVGFSKAIWLTIAALALLALLLWL